MIKDIKLSAKALSSDDENLEICFMALSKDNKHERTNFLNNTKYFLSVDISTATFNAHTLYLDHEPSFNNAIGKITEVKQDASGIKCKVQFFKEVEQSYQAYLKFKNGLSDSVSVGLTDDYDYEVIQENDKEHIIVKNAEIYELSAVWLGADPNARKINQFKKENKMAKKLNDEEIKKDDELDKEELEEEQDEEQEEKELQKQLKTQKEILKLGKIYDDLSLANEYIQNNKSVDDFKNALLEKSHSKIILNSKGAKAMSNDFLVSQMIKYKCGAMSRDKINFKLSDYELNATTFTIPRTFGQPFNGYLNDNLKGATHTDFRADLLVEQIRLESDFLSKCFLMQGLEKEIEIPRNLTQLRAEKVAYGTDQASQDLTFDTVKISPTTLRITVKLTSQMLLMSDFDLEKIVWEQSVKAFKRSFENMVLYTGYGESGKFAGLFATNKIARVNNYIASPTYQNTLNFENTLVKADFDPSNAEFYANKIDINTLKTTEKAANTGTYLIDTDNTLCGTKISHCQSLKQGDVVFGDLSNIALATFGNLKLSVLPQPSGLFLLEAFYDVGMGVLNENAFALSSKA